MPTLDDRLAAPSALVSPRCRVSSSPSPAAWTPAWPSRPPCMRWAPSGSWPRPRCRRACRRPNATQPRPSESSLGVRHEFPRTDELSRPGYRANAGNRCAFCKTELVDVLTPARRPPRHRRRRLGHQRRRPEGRPGPGIAAASARGAWAPLARGWLEEGRRPRRRPTVGAAPRRQGAVPACLASRIAYGVPGGRRRASPGSRPRRPRCGTALTDAGLAVRDLRVRDMGDDVARVEVDAALVAELTARPDVLAAVAGFERVEIDPRGFRSGSMNELLPQPVRSRRAV